MEKLDFLASRFWTMAASFKCITLSPSSPPFLLKGVTERRKKRGAVKIIPEPIMRSENEWIILSYLFLLTISLQCDSESDIDDKVRLLFMSVCVCGSVYLTCRRVSKSDFGVYSMKACRLSACVFVYVYVDDRKWLPVLWLLFICILQGYKGKRSAIERKYTYCRSVLSFLWGVIVFGVSVRLLWSSLKLKSSHLSWCLC